MNSFEVAIMLFLGGGALVGLLAVGALYALEHEKKELGINLFKISAMIATLVGVKIIIILIAEIF